MDRRSLIKNAGIAGVLAAGIAPAVHAQAAVRWRLASSFPKPLDTIYGGAEVFSNAVKAMSGGKFEISVHAAGELMPAFGVVDGVQQGSVEAAHTVPYYFYGKNPAFALGSAIPFGMIPQSIPGADLYPALEKGTLDALEWVGPYDDQKLGFNKVAKFYYYPGWWEGGPQLDFYINTKAWEGLPAEYKAVVEAAAAHANITMTAKYDARNPIALKQLVGSGTQLKPFSQDVMNAAFKSAQQIYSELNNSNPEWKKVYGDWAKFLADQNAWFRFTEGTFDRFMQQQKL